MTTKVRALAGADWFKSSYSNNQGGDCVEGARLPGGMMAVRDSKVVDGPVLLATCAAWTAFVSSPIVVRLSMGTSAC
ncbi:DUF397 domain-containing protein [Streptomyces sp. NBC_00102]|uniref:DUF397 domain-containing protein n=1 Tax=Streptomyces sp. NBC_00102 TaxID=2975652 RepID=UPI00225BD46E|nr:DUF397 domain-containing protein [Streptomyces sp. NBC_00102]MCX5399817.1 DUF397 domain-containing protein [Streptomyces sp. NBC_00102]